MGLNEQDEFLHPADSAAALERESFYMNFHDAGGRIGGMCTVGILPGQKRYEAYAILFLEDKVLFYSSTGPWETGAAHLFNVPGIACEVLLPLQKLHFRVAADFIPVDPGKLARGAPLPNATVPGGLDLIFEAFAPPFSFPPEYERLAGRAEHFEQNGYITGRVNLGGKEICIEGFGCRDRTWGIRDLSITDRGGAFFVQFGPHLTLDTLWSEMGKEKVAVGYVARDRAYLPVNVTLVSVEMDSSALPSSVQAQIGAVDGSLFSLEATITAVMPIILDRPKGRFYWYECLSRFRIGEHVGHGITEIAVWSPHAQEP